MRRTLHSGRVLRLLSNGLASLRGFPGTAAFRTRPHTGQVAEKQRENDLSVQCAVRIWVFAGETKKETGGPAAEAAPGLARGRRMVTICVAHERTERHDEGAADKSGHTDIL
jgi:hypothetical protein